MLKIPFRILASVASFSPILRAEAQNVAVFYPKAGIQQDFICMTEAVFKSAVSEGRSLTWSVFDTENDTAGVVRSASVLNSSKFTHILGTRTSQEAIALSKIAESLKIPFVAPIASHPDVTSGKKYSMRLVSTSDRYGDLMIKFLIENFHGGNVLILKNNSLPFSTFYADYLKKKLDSKESVFAAKTVDTFDGFSKFDDLARTIVKDGTKIVYAPVYTVEAVNLYNALGKIGYEGAIVSQGGVTDGKEFFEKGAIETPKIRVYYNGIWSGKLEGENSAHYIALKKKYCSAQTDTIRSVSAFDAAMFLLAGTVGPKMDPSRFVSSSKKIQFFGLMGRLKWNTEGEPLRPLHIFELQREGAKYVGAFD
jgi:ABC-type branched-subunit amino acid transport system substrate-binding protein